MMRIRFNFLPIFFLIVIVTVSNYCQVNPGENLDGIKLLMIDGKYSESIKELNSIIEKDSANVQALYYLGLNYESISSFDKAAAALSSAVLLKPDDIRLLLSLGSNYFSAGLINNADTVLSKAFLLDSTAKQIQLMLGKVYMSEKKWDAAKSIYTRLIKSDSSNSYFFEQISKSEEQLGNLTEAVAGYKIANSLNPKNINTILELSYLLYLQNQFKPAIKIVDSGLTYYPNSISLLERKGDIYLKISDYDRALDSYYSALTLGDSSSDNLKNIGICFYWRGQKSLSNSDYLSAINFLNHSIESNSKDATAFFYLGAVYKAQDKHKESVENFIQASALLKNEFLADTYTQIGAVYQLDGKYNYALEYYKDALRENPSNKSLLFYIAAVYDKLKNTKYALTFYNRFLSGSNSADKKLIEFAKNKILELKDKNSKHK